MKVLIVIVHFWNPNGSGKHQSLRPNPLPRVHALKAQLHSLRRISGYTSLLHLEDRSVYRTNSSLNLDIDIKIVTDGSNHVLDKLGDSHLSIFEHISTSPSSPMLLGYEAHRVLYEYRDSDYDYYCYMEDDLIINDSIFFQKLHSFSTFFGDKFLVQPQRYELSPTVHQVEKFFIDGPLESSPIHDFYSYPGPVRVLQYGPFSIPFESPSNPHAGCFFLTSKQMDTWSNMNYWLDKDVSFISLLESAILLAYQNL